MKGGFEVRLSRLFCFGLILIGALFVLAGIDVGFTNIVFDSVREAGSEGLKFLFVTFTFIIGSMIILSQLYFLILPPLMMRVTPEFVSFGTGFLYHQQKFPAHMLLSADLFIEESEVEVIGKRRKTVQGVEICFERDESIPSSLTTSAGITYSDWTLRLHKPYINRSPSKIVSAVREITGK
ncbi:MAG TPA: hypothetical protein ENN75_02355 [candidate division Zixibacteria bacterium]|nr:hypothetical protein [candidate division Zixibacteria bacterium]